MSSYRSTDDKKVVDLSNEVQERVYQMGALLSGADLKTLEHHLRMAIMVLKSIDRRQEDRRGA